jgi:biopolymer transport protein ExbD
MRHATDDEAPQELALVPYLDILMNLIVFVLLSLPGLAALGIVEGRAAGQIGRASCRERVS